MEIRKITSCKKDYLPLLLLGDEQESMIDRYLERGTLYALFDEGAARAVCVVTDEGNGVLEIKNIAVEPAFQKKGPGPRADRLYRKRLPANPCGFAGRHRRKPSHRAIL